MQCYKCGAKNPGKMTICKNEKDPYNSQKKGVPTDLYRRQGCSACCPKKACQDLIGKKEYFRFAYGTPAYKKAEDEKGKALTKEERIAKSQDLKCYFCKESNPGEMTICVSTEKKSPDPESTRDGLTAVCSKDECQKQIGVTFDSVKEVYGRPSEKTEKGNKLAREKIVSEYQWLKCYKCGDSKP